MADHDRGVSGLQLLEGVHDVEHHRSPADAVQGLGPIGTHPGSGPAASTIADTVIEGPTLTIVPGRGFEPLYTAPKATRPVVAHRLPDDPGRAPQARSRTPLEASTPPSGAGLADRKIARRSEDDAPAFALVTAR